MYSLLLLFVGSLTYALINATHDYPLNAQKTAVLPTTPDIYGLWTLTNKLLNRCPYCGGKLETWSTQRSECVDCLQHVYTEV